MTTEIAVINRLGVALAADSAVTITGYGQEKVFDTGDKLFELMPDEPIAIMVNGNLDFLGVPWELIIKDFRTEKFDKRPSSIEEWSIAFLDFAGRHRAVNENQSNDFIRRFVQSRISFLQATVMENIQDLFSSGKRTIKRSVVSELLISAINVRSSKLDETSKLKSLDAVNLSDTDKKYGDLISTIIGEMFGEKGITKKDAKSVKGLMLKEMLVTLDEDTRTGLVVCGFGGDDLFPSLHAVILDGVLNGRLRYEVTHDVEITRDQMPNGRTKELGTAISFAQTDVIERLLRGGDARLIYRSREFLDQFAGKALPAMFAGLGWNISDANGGAIPINDMASFLQEKLPALYDVFVDRVRDEIEREFKQTISLMPKQELIELAEALVSITAVERKATRDAGTVGGPIDVALITRAEGFVWIKRKHHFKAELNPRYLSRVSAFRTGGEAG
ncbi:hypothetical protein [Sphingomonas sp.]|uniref:hypothetical protein n=1 Tax=Sphingomonas sp. TaxID=28214 RepID=UPI0025F7D524|nr:hypothetical protein [Sphingomonas sp.]